MAKETKTTNHWEHKPGGENLSTADHAELLGDEFPELDMKVMGVFGAMRRGVPKDEALAHYKLTAEAYDQNIERVLNS